VGEKGNLPVRKKENEEHAEKELTFNERKGGGTVPIHYGETGSRRRGTEAKKRPEKAIRAKEKRKIKQGVTS